jgi:hypothetical protein
VWILPWNATALPPYSKHFILFVAQKAGVFGAGNVYGLGQEPTLGRSTLKVRYSVGSGLTYKYLIGWKGLQG